MAGDWKTLLGVAAPAIATVLGGPAAGLATGALCAFFGLGEGASQEEIAKAVAGMTPEQAIQLKKVDADFRIQMEQINVDLFKEEVADRASARDMAKVMGDKVQLAILIVTMAIFSGTLFALFAGYLEDLTGESKTIINYAIGQVSGWAQAAVAFYFGTTSSSRDKDKALANLSKP